MMMLCIAAGRITLNADLSGSSSRVEGQIVGEVRRVYHGRVIMAALVLSLAGGPTPTGLLCHFWGHSSGANP